MTQTAEETAEKAFHQKRTAFVLLNKSILLAQTGFTGSHFDLLCQTGFTKTQATEVISTSPRGYFLSNDLYLYQGEDFSCLCEENEQKALLFIDSFKKMNLLTPKSRIYSGMNIGEIGKKWSPIKEIKISL